MIVMYGISNCDTMRKSGKWLDSQGLEWSLHDYRKHGLDTDLANTLLAQFSPDVLINRRGTTWRGLSADEQNSVSEKTRAAQLIVQYPALIKRPVLNVNNKQWLIGYDQLQNL